MFRITVYFKYNVKKTAYQGVLLKLYIEVMEIYKRISIIDEVMFSYKKKELYGNRDCQMKE